MVLRRSSELYLSVNNGAHDYQLPKLYLIEYAASVFRNIPWISSDKLVQIGGCTTDPNYFNSLLPGLAK